MILQECSSLLFIKETHNVYLTFLTWVYEINLSTMTLKKAMALSILDVHRLKIEEKNLSILLLVLIALKKQKTQKKPAYCILSMCELDC